MKYKNFVFVVILFSTFYFLISALIVGAFEATSTSFEIHAGAIDSIAGISTSTNFQNTGAGGQFSTGTSTISGGTARKLFSGILYWLYGIFVPRYDQIHYRWRNDDGNEATATFTLSENVPITNLQKNTVSRLRFEISNEGWTRGAGQQFRMEYAATSTCASGSYTPVPVIASTEHWQMATSTYVTDGTATTNISPGLTDENSVFIAGQVKTTGNTTAVINLTSENFTEVEYGLVATSTAVTGQTYCFRLTNNGSTTNFNYTQYAKATISGYPATGELISPIFDTSVVNGASFNSISWKGQLNGGKIRLQLATSNCSNGATNPPTCNAGVWGPSGSDYLGTDCTNAVYYEQTATDEPNEIKCYTNHQNKRYFRYKLIICSSGDCSTAGAQTPQVDDIMVNWSP